MSRDSWRHVMMTWRNLDSGKANANAALYIDGDLKGEIMDQTLAMAWEIEKTGIYVAVNYIGLMDELAIFNRPVTAAEVDQLFRTPDLPQSLKKRRNTE